ncbi:MAG: VWA domain-containing protein [Muribaculaceae bacterium]|nr:VWA domain-containing protein [Muribaculaceae bacterium]
MLSFANPEYLYLLLLVPLVAVVFIFNRIKRRKNIAHFGKAKVVRGLMPDVSPYKPWIKLSLELLLLVMVVIILARPRAGSHKTTKAVTGIEVMVALDVSNSMLASSSDNPQDISRLQRSKMILEKLIDRFQNDKVGLIVFAGNAYTQMPITSDYRSAKMFLNGINTEMVPTQGTAIGAAINLAVNSFSKNKKSHKTIILITDGENHEDDAVGAAKDAAKVGIQVNVVGMGSTHGAPIPMPNGGFMQDDAGQVITTYLNEKMAREIASAGGGVMVNGGASDALEVLQDTLSKLAKANLEQVSYTQHDEQFPLFAWIALLLLIANLFVMERKNTWLTKFNFFRTETNKQ